jgi:hypothetical protein
MVAQQLHVSNNSIDIDIKYNRIRAKRAVTRIQISYEIRVARRFVDRRRSWVTGLVLVRLHLWRPIRAATLLGPAII